MRLISNEGAAFLKDAFVKTMDDWFDDPDEDFTQWTHNQFMEWYFMMVEVAKDCGMEFWQVARSVATDFEITRVNEMIIAAKKSNPHDRMGATLQQTSQKD